MIPTLLHANKIILDIANPSYNIRCLEPIQS